MKTTAPKTRQYQAAIKVMAQHVTDLDAVSEARLGGPGLAGFVVEMRSAALQSVGYLCARAEKLGITVIDPSFPQVDATAHLDLRARQMLSLKRATSRLSHPSTRSGGRRKSSSRKTAKAGRKAQ